MIIRSQDKKAIINFDRVDTVRLSRCVEKGVIKEHYQTDIFYDSIDTFGILGTYSTEEKAIKVLDMIQDAHCRIMFWSTVISGSSEIIGNCEKDIALNYIKQCNSNYYFQMPQDSEV